MSPWVHGIVYGFAVATVLLSLGGAATWWERKFSARLQNRIGPRYVGPFGLLQPIADVLKMLQKEDQVPALADRPLFQLAPAIAPFLVLSSAAVVPFAGGFEGDGQWRSSLVVAPIDVGLLWVLALGGLMVFPSFMAGWASNNKYTLLAAMRMVAQGVSYEIPMVLAAMVAVVATGSLSLSGIVAWQAEHGWLIWRVPVVGFLAFVTFFLTTLAEANRIPFDIPEAESELVGGVVVEYTGMKFGMFMLTEYLHTIVASAVASVLFLGGAHGPAAWLLGPLWMALKTGAVFFVIYWIRWSWYRFRSDQLMEICWRYLVPGTLGMVMATALMVSGGWLP